MKVLKLRLGSATLCFSLTETSTPALEPGQLGFAGSIPENKEAASSVWPVTEIQNAWRYASTPHRSHGMQRVDFTSTSYFQEIILRKCILKTLKIQVSGQYCGFVLICEHHLRYRWSSKYFPPPRPALWAENLGTSVLLKYTQRLNYIRRSDIWFYDLYNFFYDNPFRRDDDI